MTETRLRRSELSVPAANARFVAKAAESDADLVFLDLEDATAPAIKEAARRNAIQSLNNLNWGKSIRAIRVNAHDTEWVVHDVVDVVTGAGHNLDVLIVPKVTRCEHVIFFDLMLTALEKKLNIQHRIGIEALIEEAEALGNVEAIAKSSPRLEALILGFGDLSGSLGMRFGHEIDESYQYPGDKWAPMRTRMIAACRAAGIDAIDGPYGNIANVDGYRRESTYAASLGAVGKWCIHPGQIPHANEVFSPTQQELDVAIKMIDVYRRSVEVASGANKAGDMMVDAATVRLYQPVVDRARQIGMIE